jgi:hypothetical protein
MVKKLKEWEIIRKRNNEPNEFKRNRIYKNYNFIIKFYNIYNYYKINKYL